MNTPELIKLIKDLNTEVTELNDLKAAASRIGKQEQKVSFLHRTIIEELERKDVIQRGNFGLENRSVNFLMSLISHVEESLT